MSKESTKARSFFKTKGFSESGVALLKDFILPFVRGWDPNANIDDAIAAFFNVGTRKFYGLTATKEFQMPGEVSLLPNLYSKICKDRTIPKGTRMLMVLDHKDQIGKVQVGEREFRLRRFQLERLHAWVETVEL